MTARIPQSVREEQLNSLPNLRFVRWLDGYRNSYSKVVMQCDAGHEWAATPHALVTNGTRCRVCAGTVPIDASTRVKQINAIDGVSFVKWVDEYRGAHSRAELECEIDGHRWVASSHRVINLNTGCPKCAKNMKVSASELEVKLSSLSGMTFLRWLDRHENSKSKAVMRCGSGHEWAASVSNLLWQRSGCPSCAKGGGFDPNAPGTLYALISECGDKTKIGISNNVGKRIAQLRCSTPFAFSVVAQYRSDGKSIAELEKTFHSQFESAHLRGFDGATEWLKFNPDILAILRILGA